MRRPWASALVEVDDRRADDGDGRLGLDPGDLPFESIRARDVVGVEPGDVPAARPFQGSIERRREAEPGVVSQHRDSRVVEARDGVVRGVVDDDELEVAERLRENTVDGLTEEACVVVGCEQDGDERHGR